MGVCQDKLIFIKNKEAILSADVAKTITNV